MFPHPLSLLGSDVPRWPEYINITFASNATVRTSCAIQSCFLFHHHSHIYICTRVRLWQPRLWQMLCLVPVCVLMLHSLSFHPSILRTNSPNFVLLLPSPVFLSLLFPQTLSIFFKAFCYPLNSSSFPCCLCWFLSIPYPSLCLPTLSPPSIPPQYVPYSSSQSRCLPSVHSVISTVTDAVLAP